MPNAVACVEKGKPETWRLVLSLAASLASALQTCWDAQSSEGWWGGTPPGFPAPPLGTSGPPQPVLQAPQAPPVKARPGLDLLSP